MIRQTFITIVLNAAKEAMSVVTRCFCRQRVALTTEASSSTTGSFNIKRVLNLPFIEVRSILMCICSIICLRIRYHK